MMKLGYLNSFMLAEDKYSKDTELAESLYISGIGHRIFYLILMMIVHS